MKRLIHKDLVSVTQSMLLANAGRTLIEIFVPLLLMRNGFELWHVCLFYVGYAFAKLLVNYPSILLINARGAGVGLTFSYASLGAYLLVLTLYVSDIAAWLIYTAPVFLALTNAFLWNSNHLFISRAMDARRKSRDLAMMDSLRRVTDIATPMIGGFIAAWAGQGWLTVVAMFVVLLAIIPVRHIDKLAGGHQRVEKVEYNLRHAPRRDLIANFAFNVHVMIGNMLWPIYLAVMLPKFESIGTITTIAAIVTFVFLFSAGKRGDQGKNHRVLLEATALSSAGHLLRFFATTPFSITAITAFYRTALSYQVIPWTSLYYAHTRKRGINYIMSMEIVGDISYVIVWSLLGIVAYATQGMQFFNLAFIGAALIAWLCLLMTKEKTAS